MRNIVVVGVNGKIQSGKDTFVGMVMSILQEYDIRCRTINFADKLKVVVMDLFSLNHDDVFTQEGKARRHPELNNMTTRYILQKFGTEVARNIFSKVWVNYLIKTVRLISDIDHNVHVIFVSDMRFIDEFNAIKSMNGITVRVKRLGFEHTNQNHESEWGLDKYPYFGKWYSISDIFTFLYNFIVVRKAKPLLISFDTEVAALDLHELQAAAHEFSYKILGILKTRNERKYQHESSKEYRYTAV